MAHFEPKVKKSGEKHSTVLRFLRRWEGTPPPHTSPSTAPLALPLHKILNTPLCVRSVVDAVARYPDESVQWKSDCFASPSEYIAVATHPLLQDSLTGPMNTPALAIRTSASFIACTHLLHLYSVPPTWTFTRP